MFPGPLCIKCDLIKPSAIIKLGSPGVILERCEISDSCCSTFRHLKRDPEGDAPAMESRDTHPVIINASVDPWFPPQKGGEAAAGPGRASFHVASVMFYGCRFILLTW